MRHLTALFITGLLFIGFVSCEKVSKSEDGEKKGNTTENGNSVTTDTGHQGHSDATPESKLPLTTVQWDETAHDFGKINDVDSVGHIYKFRNTGSNPLKVEHVKVTCGCTAPSYSKDEIPPGGTGFVQLKFSPVGKNGVQAKTVTVLMNTDPQIHQLSFKAEVKGKS
jgi:hypothetical protein